MPHDSPKPSGRGFFNRGGGILADDMGLGLAAQKSQNLTGLMFRPRGSNVVPFGYDLFSA